MNLAKHFVLVNILFFSVTCRAQNADINILRSINENGSAFKDNFSKTISNSVIVVNIAAPVTLFAVGLAKHDRKLREDAAFMAGGYLLSTLITQASKRIVQRDRPYIKYPFIINRVDPNGYSFPSGHTSSAFYSATSLSLLYKKWYVIAPSYTWAVSVGYARMYLGVHYPTDVLAGAVTGAGSAWVSYKVQKWMDKKSAAKKAAHPAAF